MRERRRFMKSCAGIALTGCLGEAGHLGRLSRAVAEDVAVPPELLRFRPEIEAVVRRIEDTPRAQCLEMMVGLLRRGLPYRQFLAALYLAGIRNVNPQPPGFKFHCVFVIHSAHQVSLDLPVEDRLLPLFWALDNFKVSQQQDAEQGDFRLAPVKGPLPSPSRAWDELHAAMDTWDEQRADRAIVALVRSRGANEIIEELWRYGARDYRNIGHKAIFVANTWRTLQAIGWQHAEPALRSLVLGLLDFGPGERVNEYAFEDQSYAGNVERARQAVDKLPGNWSHKEGDAATVDLLSLFRSAPRDECCQGVLDRLLQGNASAQSVWDAVHLWSGELMMRQPGIYGIHTVTSVNGLRYAFEMAASPETRLLLLLQGVGWMGQFQHFMGTRNHGLQPVSITDLEPPASLPEDPAHAIEEILALTGVDATAAARKAQQLGNWEREQLAAGEPVGPSAESLAQAAYRLIVRKGNDAHDYKYPTAVFEDVNLVSPRWRPQMLATAVYHMRGSSQPDSPLMLKAVEAAKTL